MAINFLNTIDLNKNSLDNARIQNLSADPTAANSSIGQIYFNTTADTLKQYVADKEGSGNPGWVEVGSDSVTAGTGIGVTLTGGNAVVRNTGLVTVLDGTYINLTKQGGGDNTELTADLNASDDVAGPNERYLTKNNTWAEISAIPGTYDWDLQTDSGAGAKVTVGSGDLVEFTSGNSTIDVTNSGLITSINLPTTGVTAASYTYTALTVDAYGRITAASSGASPVEYTLPTTNGNNPDIVLTGSDSSTDIINTNGTSTTVKVTGSTNNTLEFDLVDDVTIVNDLTIGGEFTASGTGQSSFGGQVTIPTTPSAGTDAASKSYVDSLVAGGLTFKDGFNAGTGVLDGGGNLTTGATRVALEVGDFYVVTTAGSFYGSVTLDVGDSVIAKLAAAAGTSDIDDWVIIQGDEGVVNFTNSNGGTYVAYGSTNTGGIGAVTIGDVDLTAVDGTSDTLTRFLSKDNTWDVPSYTTNTDAKYALTAAAKSGSNVPLTLTGSDGGATTVVNLTEGSNITLTRNSSGQVTIASTDSGALGDRVALTGGSTAGGLTTFDYTVTSSFAGAVALDVKCEVITAAGQTVYADVTRSGTTLSVIFAGTVADNAYEALLTYVG